MTNQETETANPANGGGAETPLQAQPTPEQSVSTEQAAGVPKVEGNEQTVSSKQTQSRDASLWYTNRKLRKELDELKRKEQLLENRLLETPPAPAQVQQQRTAFTEDPDTHLQKLEERIVEKVSRVVSESREQERRSEAMKREEQEIGELINKRETEMPGFLERLAEYEKECGDLPGTPQVFRLLVEVDRGRNSNGKTSPFAPSKGQAQSTSSAQRGGTATNPSSSESALEKFKQLSDRASENTALWTDPEFLKDWEAARSRIVVK